MYAEKDFVKVVSCKAKIVFKIWWKKLKERQNGTGSPRITLILGNQKYRVWKQAGKAKIVFTVWCKKLKEIQNGSSHPMFVMYVENGFVKMVSLLCKSIESKQARPKLHLRFVVRNSKRDKAMVHKRLHTVERPYICDVYGKWFCESVRQVLTPNKLEGQNCIRH